MAREIGGKSRECTVIETQGGDDSKGRKGPRVFSELKTETLI